MPAAPIYLDYHATTPVDPRVFGAMAPYFMEVFGNPASTSHRVGLQARAAVEQARQRIATAVGAASPREIVFTSGSTESNNLAIKGVARICRQRGRHVVTAATEHKCVLNACKALRDEGIDLTILPVATDGRLSVDAVEAALRPDTILVSLMHANNEIGVVHDLAAIGALCRARGVLFHTDATQSFGKLPVDVRSLQVDLLSMSGHKMYGPKGVGALYVRTPCALAPQLDGGGHEGGLRSGTLNVPGIVGLAEAVALAVEDLEHDRRTQQALRDRLWMALRAAFPDVLLNGPDPVAMPDARLPNNLNVSLAGPAGDALLAALGDDVCVSTSSACTSATGEASHVLTAIGRAPGLTNLRISVGRPTTDAEVDAVIAAIERAAALKM
ncbi:cysteine desulfurase IscS [Luteitalea sp. TBR-22]|uniref:cysteine desulfurase family protein n=1 Tax=Luteitalea sp. TBR-22 TaxID=2802971 RepID=UPI001AFA72B6|nr:cysteine desulfurase family protein [Luteitalea sp. TBR-22]BCS32786.1 cysteine desulfurase IscS [Luteitalea sp. TBR-22]